MPELTPRQRAFVDLLSQDDPQDLPPRLHRQTHEGDPARRGRWRPYLFEVWMAWRDFERDGEMSA